MLLVETQFEKWDARLKGLDARLEVIVAKAAEMGAETTPEHNADVASLQTLQESAKDEVSKAEVSSDDTWEHIKDGAEDALNAFEEGIKTLKASNPFAPTSELPATPTEPAADVAATTPSAPAAELPATPLAPTSDLAAGQSVPAGIAAPTP